MAALREETWIAGCPRCRGHLLQLASTAGYVPDVAYETEDYVAVMGLIAEGLGIAVIPDLILRTVHHEDVTALPMTPASRRHIVAVTTPRCSIARSRACGRLVVSARPPKRKAVATTPLRSRSPSYVVRTGSGTYDGLTLKRP